MPGVLLLGVRLHRQLRIRGMILVKAKSDDNRIHVQQPGTKVSWCGTSTKNRAYWSTDACRDCIMRVIVEFGDNHAGDLRVGDTIICDGEKYELTDLTFDFPRVVAFSSTEVFAWDETDLVELEQPVADGR